MPITLQCETFPLPPAAAAALWEATIRQQKFSDEIVTVRCVDAATIQELNKEYRHTDAPTNVLTFSYPADLAIPHSGPHHDVPLCLDVATQEANERQVGMSDYVALLLAHAFLHITGRDHEKSSEEASLSQNFERDILQTCGFNPIAL